MLKTYNSACMPLILVMLLSTATGFAQASPGDKATEIQYLSGTGKDDMVEWGFYCSDGRKSGSWTTIGVPSCWELQGFGAYNYGHDPFESRANEHGLYKLSFSAPKECKGKEVKIVFEGVMTDAEVKMKEKKTGNWLQGYLLLLPGIGSGWNEVAG